MLSDEELRELIALHSEQGNHDGLITALEPGWLSEEGSMFAIAACNAAVPLAAEVLALREMLNHAARCENRNPAECNECKDIWLKGYPYAE